ncbi:MAG: hypothetical protein ACOYZ6_15225 [Chloroflexota bacterium]
MNKMLYFFILPIFVGLLIVLILAAIVTRFIPAWSRVSPYLFSGAIGFTIGFFITNFLNFLVGLASGLILKNQNIPEIIRQIINFISAIILFLGPIPASVIGAVLGFVLGIFLVHRRRRSLLA